MIDFLFKFAVETYKVFYEASIYILAGFFLAGLMRIVLRTEMLQRMLGASSFASVVKATLFGAPLPICSCGVVPAAVGLRKNGASRPATMSFLISTPETGLPSILLTWGLIGPLMAVIRPVVAMITAITAGTWILLSPGRGAGAESLPPDEDASCCPPADESQPSCCAPADDPAPPSCCSKEAEPAGTALPDPPPKVGRVQRVLKEAFHYGFVEMMDDLAFWIVFGIVLTGFLSAILPNEFFEQVVGNPTVEMVAMLLVGIPLYLCATSSTPLAAALMAKGLSPGAALVFLLAGPVTNIGTLIIVGRVFGRRFLRIYLLSIIIVCMTLGLATNALFSADQFTLWGQESASTSMAGVVLRFIGLLAFTVLAGASFQRTGFRKDAAELWHHLCTFIGWLKGVDPAAVLRRPGFTITALLITALYFSQGFFIVRPGEVGMEREFGRLSRSSLPPGLHYCPPWPFAVSEICRTEEIRQVFAGFQAPADVQPADVQSADDQPADDEVPLGESRRRSTARPFSEESLFITGDENIIQVSSATHYRVDDPKRFLYAVEDADQLVSRVVGSVLLETLGRKPIDEIYTTARAAVEQETLARTREILGSESPGSYDSGIQVISFHLLDTHAPLEVHDAFRDVASAMEDRDTMVDQAYGYQEQRLHLARGEADQSLARARAGRSAAQLAAEGETAAFQSLLDAVKGNEQLTRFRLYLESAERVLPRARLFITPDSRSAGQLDLWLRSSSPEGPGTGASQNPAAAPVEEPKR
jgi:HflK protein